MFVPRQTGSTNLPFVMSIGQGAGILPCSGNRVALFIATAALEDGHDGSEGGLGDDRGNAPEQTVQKEVVDGLAHKTRGGRHGVLKAFVLIGREI